MITMTRKLSPATKAVLDAIKSIEFDWSNMEQADSKVIAAAALRAVADAVVPMSSCGPESVDRTTKYTIRCDLFAIAEALSGVDEAGAIAALDSLYANNNDGMKLLADS